MRKIFTILIIFSCFYLNASAQSGWVSQTSGTLEDLSSVYFINENTGWVSGPLNNILFTTNGGALWTPQPSFIAGRVSNLDFTSALTGFALANNQITKTTNGGVLWTPFAIPSVFTTTDLDFANDNTGYICGAEGKVFKTTNGGVNWTTMTISPSDMNTLKVIDPNTVYVCGISGLVFKTTNGGTNWVQQTTTSNNFIKDITFADASTGYFTTLGLAEDVYKTTNGGANWSAVTSPGSTSGLNSIFAVSSSLVLAAGPNGTIRRTTNGGSNWQTQLTATTANLNGIFMVNSTTGYAVGAGGTILKTIRGGVGIQPIGSQIPERFSLSQNYPNPFNPSTSIKFSIPKAGFISLKIYDMAGNENAVIVNENLNAGEYETKFDGGNLTSGVYFYKLTSNGFTETKKMLLVK